MATKRKQEETSLFGEEKHTSSLTSALFGSTPTDNALFDDSKRFDSVVQERINRNSQQYTVKNDEELSVDQVLAQRQLQSSSDFLSKVTFVAPAKDATGAEQEGGVDDLSTDVRIQEIAHVVCTHGLAVLKNVVSPQLLDQLSVRADEITKQVCSELERKQIDYKTGGDFRFVEVASRCEGRMDVRYGINQQPFSATEIVENKVLQPLVHSLLGGSSTREHAPVLVYAGLILSFPNSDDQPWHQDGMPLFPELPDGIVGELPPHALNIFIPLSNQDGSLPAGPTEFLPASHLSADMPKVKNVISPLLEQGDALVYDYRVCHRGTRNLSSNVRRILYLMYARPWFKEHLNFGTESLFQE